MTSTSSRAIALEIRSAETNVFLGVAWVVASERYAAILETDTSRVSEPELAPATWKAIDEWVSAGDAGLPARPAPLAADVVSCLLDRDDRPAIGERFASIPVADAARTELESVARLALPGLLRARRPAE